ncbi:dGTPase [Pseudomonas taetrolens]|uniref:DGTPase n=2 Tax=Pseudomonas taetrolens TaxID=47884 RepID=A0A1H4UME4_PSETA|nr:dGTPase [Pseudomonas taetrolens]VEH50188.1 putative deoxyguanosinetriphosphate triphosphohydrolase [Pseudomonas taetrolens]
MTSMQETPFPVTAEPRSVWTSLLNANRRKKSDAGNETPEASSGSGRVELRTEIERDFDRILFCAPVRRMADKTQVFPLDRNDSVRNRLTHSHEVSNLARSFGTTLVYSNNIASEVSTAVRDIPSLLAAVGLVHDLGNPPFGHQGEGAIQSWFSDNINIVAGKKFSILTERQYRDFLKFEGNAQAFRLVTRLQVLNDDFGLDLTVATLAAMMKYPVGSMGVNKSNVCTKKHGFFLSEESIAKHVLESVGLAIGKRHPMSYIMEACDDIAYAVLDIEDAVKKGLASFSDLLAYLEHHASGDEVIADLVAKSRAKHIEYRLLDLSPAELNDVSMQRFRVYAIGLMINSCVRAFVSCKDGFIEGTTNKALLDSSDVKLLRRLLGDFSFNHTFQHRSVLEVELTGYNTIRGLMDIFWAAILETNPDNGVNRPSHPYNRYVFMRISENYRRVYNSPSGDLKGLPLRYRQCLLLTDMISGMTDSFAVNLLQELRSYQARG